MHGIFLFCGFTAVAFVLFLTGYLLIAGLPAIRKIGLIPFLTGIVWNSTGSDPQYGIAPFILTSFYGTFGAIVLGVPVGVLTAIYLAKMAGGGPEDSADRCGPVGGHPVGGLWPGGHDGPGSCGAEDF